MNECGQLASGSHLARGLFLVCVCVFIFWRERLADLPTRPASGPDTLQTFLLSFLLLLLLLLLVAGAGAALAVNWQARQRGGGGGEPPTTTATATTSKRQKTKAAEGHTLNTGRRRRGDDDDDDIWRATQKLTLAGAQISLARSLAGCWLLSLPVLASE